jgi:Tn7-like transposition protein D/TniQ
MTVVLPRPYDDESLLSVIGRYMVHTSVEKQTTVIRALFGRLVMPPGPSGLLTGLNEVARQTKECWGRSGLDIAIRMTPLPYYTSFVTERQRCAAFEAALDCNAARLAHMLGVNASRVSGPHTFRFCMQCAEEDFCTLGETYWRRSFQLPGVFVCPNHLTMLRASRAPTGGRSLIGWYAASDFATLRDTTPLYPRSDFDRNPHILKIIESSIALLTSKATLLSAETHKRYLSEAARAGLTKHGGVADRALLRSLMLALFGDEYLNAIGLSLTPERYSRWMAAMLLDPGACFQPIQHLLLSHAFSVSQERLKMTNWPVPPSASKQYSCPNQYAKHGKGHVVERVIFKWRHGQRVGYGRCSCGCRFSFLHCHPGTLEPVIQTVYRYGQDWCEAAKRLRQGGASHRTIAVEMNVPIVGVKALLKDRAECRIGAAKRDILRWRREWRQLLKDIKPRGHGAAKRLNPHLYYMLNRYDREWLERSARRFVRAAQIAKTVRRARVNRHQRDVECSERLRDAAARLSAAGSLRRICKTAILDEAKLTSLSHSKVILHMPICQATLRACVESISQFYERHVIGAVSQLRADGVQLAAWRIFSKAHIPASKVTPQLEKLVENLMGCSTIH